MNTKNLRIAQAGDGSWMIVTQVTHGVYVPVNNTRYATSAEARRAMVEWIFRG